MLQLVTRRQVVDKFVFAVESLARYTARTERDMAMEVRKLRMCLAVTVQVAFSLECFAASGV